MIKRLLLFAALCSTMLGTTWNSDGSQADVISKIAGATAGDTITVPAGTFTWGASDTYVDVNKAVTLLGAGQGSSNIVISTTAPTGRGGVIRITGGGTIRGFTFTHQTNSGASWFSANTTAGWRLAYCTYTAQSNSGGTVSAYCNGLIDHCTITGASGSQEHIWTSNGTPDSDQNNDYWEIPETMGSVNAVYVEDCTWNGDGYVSDVGYGSKAVFRFNTFNGQNKIDVHGPESNLRGGRHIEAYNNAWTITGSVYFKCFDIRGGGLVAFDNTAVGSASDWFSVYSYGFTTNNFGAYALANQWWTPSTYPIPDQTGVGADPRTGGAEPAYVFHNTRNGSEWTMITTDLDTFTLTTDAAGYAIGATAITITTGSRSLFAGNAVAFAGDNHRYLVASTFTNTGTLTLQSPGLLQAIPASATTVTAGAATMYQQQTSNPSATFTNWDIIKTDIDLFITAGSFNGSTGIGRGTTAQMNAITPTTTGVGFWVTDQGSWRAGYTGTSGVLYRWSGSAWVLYYTPFQYPHPYTLDPTAAGFPSRSGAVQVTLP